MCKCTWRYGVHEQCVLLVTCVSDNAIAGISLGHAPVRWHVLFQLPHTIRAEILPHILPYFLSLTLSINVTLYQNSLWSPEKKNFASPRNIFFAQGPFYSMPVLILTVETKLTWIRLKISDFRIPRIHFIPRP